MKREQVLIEARAKIIWGEPAADVRSFLLANSVSDADAAVAVKGFIAERNAEIRKFGIRKIVIGAGLAISTALLFYWEYQHQFSAGTTIRSRGSALGFTAFGFIYGLWKLIDGIFDLVRPQTEDGSISDMSD
jgi:hypothetical protein